MERLKRNPDSHYRAELLGEPALVGWGTKEYLAAAQLNAINTQLKGKKLSRSEMVQPPMPKNTGKKIFKKKDGTADFSSAFEALTGG